MEVKNINTFLRAAELSSFTKAANELGYTQSTVTIQIKQLEKDLGVKLFDRIGKSVSLTPAGEAFLPYANQYLQLDAQIHAFGKSDSSAAGTLRLGVLESLFVWKIADLLPEYHKQFPNVTIEINSTNGAALYRMLRQNELDIIYLLDNVIYQKDCVRACAAPVAVKFVTWPGSSLCKRRGLTLADIARAPLILTERDAIYRRVLDHEAAAQGVELVPILEVDNLEVVIRLLKRRMGVSFMPDFVIREFVGRGELAELEVKDGTINLWSQLVYHKNKFLTPQMRSFIELIQNSPPQAGQPLV